MNEFLGLIALHTPHLQITLAVVLPLNNAKIQDITAINPHTQPWFANALNKCKENGTWEHLSPTLQ